ncbi:MAG: DUF308 domain-containing protein [Verrucomicrobiae bacterium]|nr:DUF308 domain-containing protein [Verrucomicrobiae bacterium]
MADFNWNGQAAWTLRTGKNVLACNWPLTPTNCSQMSNPNAQFAKCSCQNCNGHIEFDAEQVGEAVTCPHCGLETKLFVPAIPLGARAEAKRGVSPLGIAALVLGILSCLFCWIPLLGLFALPIAFIGVLLAVGGVLMASINKKTGFAFPIGGGIVCVLAASIALVITGGFSFAWERGKRTNQQPETSAAVREPAANTHEPTPATPESANVTRAPSTAVREPVGAEWSRARTVRQGDIRVAVNSVHIGRVNHLDVLGEIQSTREEFLTIDLAVANLSPTKKINFQTWRGATLAVGGAPANLADNHGNNYKRITMTPNARRNPSPDEVSIYPQNEHRDLVVFELPVENIQWLRLELPASNFGGSGMLRFEIPMSNVLAAWKAVRVARAEREAFWATSPTMAERMRVQGAYHRKVDAAEARLAIVETNLYAIPQ